jgi:tryptophan synthase beta subunit
MSEGVGGITELQLLEAEVQLLRKKLGSVKKAEKTSSACRKIISSVHASEGKDFFLVGEGRGPNPYHTSAGVTADRGCCNVL